MCRENGVPCVNCLYVGIEVFHYPVVQVMKEFTKKRLNSVSRCDTFLPSDMDKVS